MWIVLKKIHRKNTENLLTSHHKSGNLSLSGKYRKETEKEQEMYRMIKVLGKAGIIEAMKKGAYIYRVSGRYGGWGISGADDVVTVRADSCRNVVNSGLVEVSEMRFGYVAYRLK